jgi:hypothetical protein
MVQHFLAALINSTHGFYSPSQLVQDAQLYSVQVRAVDVTHSVWDYALKPPQRAPRPANRLIFGIRQASLPFAWVCGWSPACLKARCTARPPTANAVYQHQDLCCAYRQGGHQRPGRC